MRRISVVILSVTLLVLIFLPSNGSILATNTQNQKETLDQRDNTYIKNIGLNTPNNLIASFFNRALSVYTAYLENSLKSTVNNFTTKRKIGFRPSDEPNNTTSTLRNSNFFYLTNTITGKIYYDLNYNGTYDVTDTDLPGIAVNAYDVNGLITSTTSNGTGDYTLSVTNGTEVRIEFDIPANYFPNGETPMRLVTAPATNENMGFTSANISEFCANTSERNIITSCFVNGDPTVANSVVGGYDAIATMRGDISTGAKKMILATLDKTGSIWGMATTENDTLAYMAATLKRNVGLGPNGLGAIYKLNSTGYNDVSLFYDFGALVGTVPSNVARGLSGDPSVPAEDTDVFPLIGKVGIGDIDLNAAKDRIYAVNLNDQKLYYVPIPGDGSNPSPGSAVETSTPPWLSSNVCGTVSNSFYINCGNNGTLAADAEGREFIDGELFSRVFHSTATQVNTISNINSGGSSGTSSAELYHSYFANTTGGNLNFAYGIPNGTYTVRLHFREHYVVSGGAREMDIEIEGNLVDDDLDIWTEAGGRHIALIKNYTGISVSDGLINIDILRVTANPVISGIEIIPVSFSTQATGVFRPWATKVGRDGLVYIGGVCTAENSHRRDQLEARVYAYNPVNNTWNSTPVVTVDLDYARQSWGWHTATSKIYSWTNWIDYVDQMVMNGLEFKIAGGIRNIAQPILSDIEFLDDGDMVLGFSDRGAFQLSDDNYYPGAPYGDGSGAGISVGAIVSAGDVLRADSTNTTTWTLENDGMVGGLTTSSLPDCGDGAYASGNAGPGGKEFYSGDNTCFYNHWEGTLGALAYRDGENQVISSMYDPTGSVGTQGYVWLNNTNGTRDTGFVLITNQGSNSGFSEKGLGMGDVEYNCPLPKIEIGNVVWNDENHNGLQDPGEPGIQSISILLFEINGSDTTVITSSNTDSDGKYLFSTELGHTLRPNGTYIVVINPFQYNPITKIGTGNLADLETTTVNATSIGNAEIADSEGATFNFDISGINYNWWGHQITLGNSFGKNDYSIDFGFRTPCELNITTSYSENCTEPATNNFTADWKIGFEVTTEVDNAISYQRNSDAVQMHTLKGTTDTLTISGIPADGGVYDTLKIWFTNETACADTIILKRPLPCPIDLGSQPGEICAFIANTEVKGAVFEDWNYDGVMNQSDTIGVLGIQVIAYDCDNNAVDTTYTDAKGNYQFTGLTAGMDYRIEFILPESVACWAKPTQAGADNGTTVQFVQPGNCASLGVAAPTDYCNENVQFITSCYVVGPSDDPTYGSNVGIVSYFNSGGSNSQSNETLYDNPAAHPIGIPVNQIGSVWGIAYDRKNEKIFTSAGYKAHSGFGPLSGESTGAIYIIDNSVNSGAGGSVTNATLFMDLNSVSYFNGRTGTTINPNSSIPNQFNFTYSDALFNAPAKTSLGDLEISDDGQTLFTINLHSRELYEIPIGENAIAPTKENILVSSMPSPASCTGDTIRPYALAYHKGMVYIGMVCSAEVSQDSTKLRAYVYEYTPSSGQIISDPVLEFPLNYDRGITSLNWPNPLYSEWKPWLNVWDNTKIQYQPSAWNPSGTDIVGYPQPVLTDIEFDRGDMILGFTDRFGDQFSWGPDPAGSGKSNLALPAGDILRAGNNGDGTWSIEQNGTVVSAINGTKTSGGAGNSEGPAPIMGGIYSGTFGEYYFDDSYPNNAIVGFTAHDEVTLGGLVQLPGNENISVVVYDPVMGIDAEYSQGGVAYFNNNTGAWSKSYRLYDENASNTYGKGNGFGDLEGLCPVAPIEIGNYIWEDTDGNGIQDACEPGIENVRVELYSAAGVLLAFDTTDVNGQYYFSHSDSTDQHWIAASDSVTANTTYHIVVGRGDFTANQLSLSGNNYTLTTDSLGNSANRYAIDSNAEVVTSSPANAFDNLPATQITTGDWGCVDHSFDFGFRPVCNLNITTTYSENCTELAANDFTAEWKIGFEVTGALDNAISYQRNSDAVQMHTLTETTDTLTISGIPADGGVYDTLKVWFTNETSCADTIILKRPLPCPIDLGSQPGEICAFIANTEIKGAVFEDWNYDGMMNQSDTIGVQGIQVIAYDCNNNAVDTTYTDAKGNYQFTGLTAGMDYRIEFILPESVACWAKPTQVGADNGTTVQFVQPGNCASLGVASPSDYCQDNPFVFVPCFVAGDPLSGNATYDTFDALVGFNHDSDANSTAGLTQLAFASDIGATWGVSYQRSSQTVFTSAALKRHFGFGTIDGTNPTTGGIYAIEVENLASPSIIKWLDVNTIGINTGANPRDGSAANSVAALPTSPSYDAAAYTKVGKIGIGDIDIQDDKTLWLVNLNDRSLYGIQNITPNSTPTSSDVLGPFPLPNTGCGSGEEDVRPWGLKVYKGKVYIGAICSGETSQDSTDLHAFIFEFDPVTQSMMHFFDFDMNYERGTIDVGGTNDVGDWRAWQTTWPDQCIRPEGLPPSSVSCNGRRTNMQPILSDIEFDLNGNMILGIMDRWGMQTQEDHYRPDPTATDTDQYWLFIAPGDVLRVCNVSGSYVFEGGIGCTQSPLNTNGGSGSEFYNGDHGTKSNTSVLPETALGALLYLQGDDEVMITQWDPYITYNSGGTSTLSNSTGNFNRRQLVYGGTTIGPIPPDPNDGYGAKGVGLGDLEAECQPAPIEIGNYVWEDTDGNGIQDACEPGIENVRVELYSAAGVLLAFDTTDANGQYYFSHSDSADQHWIAASDSVEANTTYHIVVGRGDFTANQLSLSGNDYTLTTDSLGNSANRYAIDSDAEVVTSSPANAFDNLPATQIITGDWGCVDHSFDFGFRPVCNMNITTTYSENCTEPTVGMYTADWKIGIEVAHAPDNAISYQRNSDVVQMHTLTGTTDTLTIAGIPADGSTYDTIKVWFTNDMNCADTSIFWNAPPLEIGNYVWCDSIFNGIQDLSEKGVDSLIVRLYNASGLLIGQDSTIGGFYNFNPSNVDTTGITVDGIGVATPNTHWTGLTHNQDYQVVFGYGQYQSSDGTFIIGEDTYAGFTLANQGGDDDLDSDVAGTTFLSFSGSKPRFYPEIDITTPSAGCENQSYDMGLLCGEIVYSLGNQVFQDADNSGDLNGLEMGLDGVQLQLLNLDASVYDSDTAAAGIQPLIVTTANGGYYRFDSLLAGGYRIEVIPANFLSGGALEYYLSSTGPNEEITPNSDVDSNDNGIDSIATGAIRSRIVTLGQTEPLGETEPNSYDPSSITGNEVEDGFNNLTVDFGFRLVGNFDYGDLPDIADGTTGVTDYETYDSTGGPNHLIIIGLYLGDTVDVDTDGFPDGGAFGDDLDGLDDEDGITILSSLNAVPEGTIRLPLSVTNTTNDTAYIEAWIDWNGDGDFDIVNELVADLKDNEDGIFPAYLDITIPPNALTGSSVGFRIRLSNTNNMTPYGRVNSGEVEDYMLSIDCPQLVCPTVETQTKRE